MPTAAIVTYHHRRVCFYYTLADCLLHEVPIIISVRFAGLCVFCCSCPVQYVGMALGCLQQYPYSVPGILRCNISVSQLVTTLSLVSLNLIHHELLDDVDGEITHSRNSCSGVPGISYPPPYPCCIFLFSHLHAPTPARGVLRAATAGQLGALGKSVERTSTSTICTGRPVPGTST